MKSHHSLVNSLKRTSYEPIGFLELKQIIDKQDAATRRYVLTGDSFDKFGKNESNKIFQMRMPFILLLLFCCGKKIDEKSGYIHFNLYFVHVWT